MSREQQVRQSLLAIEQLLHEQGLWKTQVPEAEAFNSSEPFCVDTMHPLEWLQWILIPRMQALLDSEGPLPKNFAIAPYYDVALESDTPGRLALLVRLKALDDLFTDSAN
ncbi:hypothetical protein ED28_12120 [[Pantoea] beijingensis]|uniref:YqcC-like domain-containing protein n=1 Tax=[Pantoea] beijingensis TaxID=1324864 RepID=A0A443IBW8_9GAMM|nr:MULTISPECIES: YqcC family protein [Erwiniaceae]RWR01761.1 hypothetical protein ED28_12120 [[Pantoea] beijingensis]